MNTENNKNKDISEIDRVLDKMILLKKGKEEPSFLRKTVYVVSGICVVLFSITICISIYKNNFSTESILSTLLAFFSIFISIFFYFKADETSNKFYNTSYDFMKDVSVTLGKIEERFGEKLNNLNDKISHLNKETKETTKEIEDKQEDKDKIIKNLLEQDNLSKTELEQYRTEIEKKDREIELLKRRREIAEQEAFMLRRKINNEMPPQSNLTRIIFDLLNNEVSFNELPIDLKKMLIKSGYSDFDGNLNTEKMMMDYRFPEPIIKKYNNYRNLNKKEQDF